MLDVTTKKIVGVKSPLKYARKQLKSKQIGILATKSVISSKGLTQHIKKITFQKFLK